MTETDTASTPTATPALHTDNGTAWADSRDIAERFGKRHADVLRAIDSIECSPDFRQRNFAFAPYRDGQDKERPAYRINRDGFAFLVMGFTGPEAARWKETYINAFNAMETALRAQAIEASEERAREAVAALDAAQTKLYAHDLLTKTQGTFSITQAAKMVGGRPSDLRKWLRRKGWLYRKTPKGAELASQRRINRGFMVQKAVVLPSSGPNGLTKSQPRLTSKGLTHLANVKARARRDKGDAK